MREAVVRLLKDVYPTFSYCELNTQAVLEKVFLIVDSFRQQKMLSGNFVLFDVSVYAPLSIPFLLDETVQKVIILLHKKRLKKFNKDFCFFVEYVGNESPFIEKSIERVAQTLTFKAVMPKDCFF